MWIYSGGECVEFVGEDEEVTKAMIEEGSENVEYNYANTQ
jgi:hypothetical protein